MVWDPNIELILKDTGSETNSIRNILNTGPTTLKEGTDTGNTPYYYTSLQ
jgi:hypothetical protein